jgi:hypothetical protein
VVGPKYLEAKSFTLISNLPNKAQRMNKGRQREGGGEGGRRGRGEEGRRGAGKGRRGVPFGAKRMKYSSGP